MKRRTVLKYLLASPFIAENARSQERILWSAKSAPFYSIDSLLGINIWRMSKESFFEAGARDFMKRVSPASLRYPPGETANFWDGERGTVIDQFKSGLIFPYNTPFNFQEISDVSSSFQTRIDYILNMTTSRGGGIGGDVDFQISVLKEAAEKGIEIDRIELGNELFGDSDKFGGYKRKVFPTAREYCAACSEWIPKIKTVFPGAQFGISLADTETTSFRAQWNGVVRRFSPADAWVIHPYFGDGFNRSSFRATSSEDAQQIQRSRFKSPEAARQLLLQPRRKISSLKRMLLGRDFSKALWFSEYDFTDRVGQIRGTWAHGIMFAYFSLLLLEFGRGTAITPYNFAFDPINFQMFSSRRDFEGVSGALSTYPGQPTASGIALELLGKCAHQATKMHQLLFAPADARTPRPEDDSGLYGWAFEGSNIRAMLLNTSSEVIELKSFSTHSEVEIFSSELRSRIYGFDSVIRSVQKIEDRIILPPYSMAVL